MFRCSPRKTDGTEKGPPVTTPTPESRLILPSRRSLAKGAAWSAPALAMTAAAAAHAGSNPALGVSASMDPVTGIQPGTTGTQSARVFNGANARTQHRQDFDGIIRLSLPLSRSFTVTVASAAGWETQNTGSAIVCTGHFRLGPSEGTSPVQLSWTYREGRDTAGQWCPSVLNNGAGECIWWQTAP